MYKVLIPQDIQEEGKQYLREKGYEIQIGSGFDRDTLKKEIAVAIEMGGKTVTIGGMCKGSGMIHPNMTI